MILQKPSITIRQSMLNWLIPVIFILCTNSIQAVGTTPAIQKIGQPAFMQITMSVDTMDYSALTQKELKEELKKLKKTDRELYYQVKSEFLKPNETVRVFIGLLATFAAISLGLIVGCLIYSLEQE